ncbi:MAG TPA: helix-turn-helix domain-containing protein [Alphaproteobacteria bacterium]|nr:helix-turn-helix domain-containing protein [Alphaproteobacteria bacterium]
MMNNVAVTPAISADSESPFIKRTYTVDEIQDILGISRSSAYNFVKQGLFRTVRVGGSIRISKKSFDEWLDKQL